jgi:hypothetical protein
MAQDYLVVAPNFLQGSGQFRHPVERSVIVDCLGEFGHGGHQQTGMDAYGHERVAEDFPHQCSLGKKFAWLGAKQGAIGNSSLGAAGCVSGGYFRVRGGSIPGRLASGSLTGKPSSTQFARANMTIDEHLRCFHRSTTEIVDHAPDSPRTSHGKQSQFAVARLAPKKFKHRMWFRSILPLGFSHETPSIP